MIHPPPVTNPASERSSVMPLVAAAVVLLAVVTVIAVRVIRARWTQPRVPLEG